ncbi:MAG: dTDP-4-dehydrorhamnose 3,5-epimerase [Alphaproteobacteria bacterium]|nr:dTDP-4-dehydrorhamnose 3,5-epimerase [Alphaproteobacteria bacterium]
MKVVDTQIPEVKIVTPAKFGDRRGFFSETYSRKAFAASGIDLDFVQDNHASSAEPGTVRGLHFQIAPMAQAKLVRVTRGAIFDVAVDIRRGSRSFGKWVGARISAEAWNQILVPAGFAHGYCTLEPDTEVVYKVTDYYAPEHERGFLWNDPAVGIDWPVVPDKAILSDKDRKLPGLADLPAHFTWSP